MGIIRNALRKVIDHELGVLGGEIEQLEHTLAQQEEVIISLRKRFDLMQSRVGMRVKRAALRDDRDDEPRSGGGLMLSEEEEAIVRELRNGRFPEGTWQ